ncbi:mechanosensitive ion channel family protein [Petrotoga sp. 9PWA.NaAc.5.4]|uniref:mechanosensitive ion channel family protein n=1 Tax=Petrotoga sp. 9PWA.NaAc.5.4 TaxID=1434328 RepID=UPI000CC44F98|nr:mechanosensitive ion channel family protein [Petrotoga sp. 9PWA.NaAc.5.4]PNR92487.1 small mechanosensitive ion channel protein MscS [Petrotoga sp. 9PWA.NaAc.5.4]
MEEWLSTALNFIIRIAISVAIIFVARYIGKVVYRIIISTAEKRGHITLQYKNSLMTMINIAMYTLAGFVIISVIFTNLSAFLAGLGIGGIIVAFAVQEPLGNLICGFLIMMNHLVVDGEAVEINGISGSVEEININHVVIRTWDGRKINLPSKEVWSSKIIHYWPSDIRRNEIKVGVSYSSDLEKVVKVLNEAVQSAQLVHIDDDHQPLIVFDSYGDSSINFIVRFWAKRENFINSSLDVAKTIKLKFKENDIEIPFTQIDLHVRDVNPDIVQNSNKI